MTTIYLINNSLTLNNLNFPENESLESKRKRRILSIEGEQAAQNLAKEPYFQNINAIYSSSYAMALATAKYLAHNLELDIKVHAELNERLIGELNNQKIRLVQEMQESDFNYKLPGGESLNDTKIRMLTFINHLLKEHVNQKLALFTHNVAITSLLINYCEEGFNLDNRLILNYHDESIIDGSWDGIKVIKLEFDNQELININRLK